MNIQHATDILLRHQIAELVREGVSPWRDAFERLAAALGRPGNAAAAAKRLYPRLTLGDRDSPDEAARALIGELGAQAPAQADVEPPGRPPVGQRTEPTRGGDRPTTPGPATGGPGPVTDGPGPTNEPGGHAVLTSPRLRLTLRRVHAVHVTEPRDDPDEFLLTGGYVYNNSGMGELNRFRRPFADGEDHGIDPPLTLANVAVVEGTTHFDATIVSFEEDLVDADLAGALGLVISLSLTLGVEAAIRYLTAKGLPAELSENAQKLLRQHGITGVRSWFEGLIGPEQFEIFTLRATLDWRAGEPIRWASWISEQPRIQPTVPPRSVGADTHDGQAVRIREMRFFTGANGPAIEYIADGGLYDIYMQLVLEGH